ncbi:MAG: hypothetical protein K0M63_03575 [Weeksellaceae bacterium]|nr:hypothetical protein [Weeksellaceae bacterium]
MSQNHPGKSTIQSILSRAFYYWNKTLVYQVMFSLIYFSVLITVLFFFAEHYGIMDDYLASIEQMQNGATYAEAQKGLIANPNYINFSWVIIGTLIFLYPLNLGLFKMYRKIDLGEKPTIQDLFAGYLGVNFFIYTSYYLFWFMIFLYTIPTVVLAAVWIGLTLFTAPLMFFMDKKIFETFRFNIKGWRNFFPAILVGMLVAIAFKYIGAITLVGLPFTLAFPTAMIYSLYRTIFKENS